MKVMNGGKWDKSTRKQRMVQPTSKMVKGKIRGGCCRLVITTALHINNQQQEKVVAQLRTAGADLRYNIRNK